MVAFTGFSTRPDTYIISTGSNNSVVARTTKNPKLKVPTTTIMVKTVSTLPNNNATTKMPNSATKLKTTLTPSAVHRILSPKQQSLGTASSSTTTMTPSSTQKNYFSAANLSSSSWTTLLRHNPSNSPSCAYSDSDESTTNGQGHLSCSSTSNCGATTTSEAKKRRRLSHLTPEEKILRRKLKNRVAAQTARDRKKAQMNDMEEMIANLQAENKKLVQHNNTLQKKAYDLVTENAELRQRLGQLENGECPSILSGNGKLVKAEPKSPRSAEPSVPQLKKQALILYFHIISQLASILSLVIYSHSLKKCAIRKVHRPFVLKISSHSHPQQVTTEKQKKTFLLLVQCRKPVEWWGPHQHNWTPSMN